MEQTGLDSDASARTNRPHRVIGPSKQVEKNPLSSEKLYEGACGALETHLRALQILNVSRPNTYSNKNGR